MLKEKDYCDYDTCVALRKLGYNAPQRLIPDYFGVFEEPQYDEKIHLYDAQKWLREEKGVVVLVHHLMTQEGDWEWEISYRYSSKDMYHSYEDALLEGIKEAVKLLKEKK